MELPTALIAQDQLVKIPLSYDEYWSNLQARFFYLKPLDALLHIVKR